MRYLNRFEVVFAPQIYITIWVFIEALRTFTYILKAVIKVGGEKEVFKIEYVDRSRKQSENINQ